MSKFFPYFFLVLFITSSLVGATPPIIVNNAEELKQLVSKNNNIALAVKIGVILMPEYQVWGDGFHPYPGREIQEWDFRGIADLTVTVADLETAQVLFSKIKDVEKLTLGLDFPLDYEARDFLLVHAGLKYKLKAAITIYDKAEMEGQAKLKHEEYLRNRSWTEWFGYLFAHKS